MPFHSPSSRWISPTWKALVALVLLQPLCYRRGLLVVQAQAQGEDEPVLGGSQQFSSQVQARVYDTIDVLMHLPVTSAKLWASYYELGGFPNHLGAADRDAALTYMYSRVINVPHTKPYYGLENGLLLGYGHGAGGAAPELFYREPGNSGYYEHDDTNTTKNHNNHNIYWNTCVDSFTGVSTNCRLKEGDLYVSCVDNCSLVPCIDEDLLCLTNTSTTAEPTALGTATSSSTLVPCAAPKMCIHYEIVRANSANLGYVPETLSCHNDHGQPSQAVGGCTYKDGTLVQRNDTGPFAYCGGDGAVCNTTFVGGYASDNYDPRWRDWYTNARAYQRPRYSDPYVFFGLETIGMTYAHPIYDVPANTTFAGVLAEDILLEDISGFLVEAFRHTQYSVAVYEEREPHKMMGVSTGSPLVGQECSDPATNSTINSTGEANCTVVHKTIYDFGATFPEDDILLKAHLEFESMGRYDPDDLVVVREDDDDLFSDAYLAIHLLYEQVGANLEWFIVVAAPMDRGTSNSILPGEPMFRGMCAMAVIGFAFCLGLFLLFFQHRNERAVQFSDFQFTSGFVLGCAFLNLTTLTLLGENTEELCLLRMWSFYLVFTMTLSPLFMKAFRAWMLLAATVSQASQHRLSNCQARIWTLPLPLIQVCTLLIFTYVDPPLPTPVIDLHPVTPTYSVVCQHETMWFEVLQVVFHFALMIIGCVLAYLTRNIDPRFGDAKGLLFAMYNITFTSVMLAAINGVVDVSESSRYLLQSICLVWETTFSVAALVVPRLIMVKEDRKLAKKVMQKLRRKMETNRCMADPSNYSVLEGSTMHEAEDSLKILVCSANVGNAEPTLSSMKAWLPNLGACGVVTPLPGEEIEADKFDLVVIGMQEATWKSKKKKKNSESMDESESDASYSDESEREKSARNEAYLKAIEGSDTVGMRNLIRTVLGEDYLSVAEEMRGQMKLYILATSKMKPFIEDVKVSGANTGIGNVLANKGGIVISLCYRKTRMTFLSAHLAAHEGEKHYQSRCNNVYDILKLSQTFELSEEIDTAISSHHMFVLGDLNFRTKFDSKNTHEENLEKALAFVDANDWSSLYSFDELHKGVEHGDLLVKFDTLPCNFNPTFKVKRENGYVYNRQRTPSYTDRILFKSAPGIHSTLKPLAYEPCVDFITSDHKPIRGAFSLVPNDMIEGVVGKFRVLFSEMECSDLIGVDMDGSSDPYIKFVWDSVEMTQEGKGRFYFRFPTSWGTKRWPTTSHKSKTLNPKWRGQEMSLLSLSKSIGIGAMLYLVVCDYDFGSEDDILGTCPINVQDLVSLEDENCDKEIILDEPLERYGKFGGRIRCKITVSQLCG